MVYSEDKEVWPCRNIFLTWQKEVYVPGLNTIIFVWKQRIKILM